MSYGRFVILFNVWMDKSGFHLPLQPGWSHRELTEMTEHTEDDTETDNDAADQTDAGRVTLASVAIISAEPKLIIGAFIVSVDLVLVLFTRSAAFINFCKERIAPLSLIWFRF